MLAADDAARMHVRQRFRTPSAPCLHRGSTAGAWKAAMLPAVRGDRWRWRDPWRV